MSKRDKPRRLGPVEVLVVVLVWLLLLVVIRLASQRFRSDAFHMECAKNLSVISKAMLMYANDYDGQLPRSSGRGATWASRIPDWRAADRFAAYGLAPNGSGGLATISSCFYLLVKYAGVSPGSFVCPRDSGTIEFRTAEFDVFDKTLVDLWDFGPEPYRHCSYSYHMPFGLYALTTSSEPAMAVAADRNPWMDFRPAEAKDMRFFLPDGGRESVKAGNARAHDDEGQNVLFLDGHVAFENEPFCGIHDDNIYTFWDGGDIRRGGPPGLGSTPQDRMDSLLVNEPIWHDSARSVGPPAPWHKPTRKSTDAEIAGRAKLPVPVAKKRAAEAAQPTVATKACDPSPADGSLYADTWVALSWSPGASSHNVYFGDNFDDVNDGTGGTFQGNQTSPYLLVGFVGFACPDGLVPGTTYYWRIDELEADATKIHKGDVWSFTVLAAEGARKP